MPTGAELLVAALENEGVDRVFGVPGEENLDVLEAMRRSGRIELVLTRHEQSAAFMAATTSTIWKRACRLCRIGFWPVMSTAGMAPRWA